MQPLKLDKPLSIWEHFWEVTDAENLIPSDVIEDYLFPLVFLTNDAKLIQIALFEEEREERR